MSIVLLLASAVAVLNLAGISLFREDKLAYTYQAQATEAVLLANEVSPLIENSLEVLKQVLKQVDPRAHLTLQEVSSRLKSIKERQRTVEFLATGFLLQDGTLQLLGNAGSSNLNEFLPDPASSKLLLPGLKKEGFAFFNASKVESGARIGILLSDLKYQDPKGRLYVSIAWISVETLGRNIHSSRFALVSPLGWPLYSSDVETLYQNKTFLEHPLFQAATNRSVANGSQEYDLDGEKRLGSYFKMNSGLIGIVSTPWVKAMRPTYALTEKFVLFAGMAIGLAIIFSILFARKITGPVNDLYEATREVAKGHFDLQLKIQSTDEIGALSSSFGTMSRKIVELIEQSKESVRIENELAIASTVQRTLIPTREFKNDKITIASHYESASECGGDWWGFFALKNHVALFIADATGHGLPSALLTASARSCVSVIEKIAEENPDALLAPADMLSYANRVIYDAAQGNIMMTFFVGLIDFESSQIHYASAGHNPPWLFKKGANGYEPSSLIAQGQRLGESRDYVGFEQKSLSFDEGDLLVLYTDGIIEGTNAEGTMFGKKHFRKLIQKTADLSPETVIDGLMTEFKKHNGTKPFDDDVTLAISRLHGGKT